MIMERNTRSPLCLMLEAVLFASGEPVTLSRLVQACEAPESTVLTALKQLSAWYEKQRVRSVCSSWATAGRCVPTRHMRQ
ncbi:MAG: SMC-Scp complex subunit ScpB [Ruminococcus callidus]